MVETRENGGREMETEGIVRITVLAIALGIIHWALVPMTLERLVDRPKVVGNKALWGAAIVFATCLGSLAFLLVHPDSDKDTEAARECCGDNWWDN
jgi:uncharacterized membrane protein YwzB